MRHVHFDRPAALRAAGTCRDAAHELRTRAMTLETILSGATWAGGARREAGSMLHELGIVMRARAAALLRTAAAIDGAIAMADALEAERRAAASVCPLAPAVTTMGPSVSAGPSDVPAPLPARSSPATSTGAAAVPRVPVGVR